MRCFSFVPRFVSAVLFFLGFVFAITIESGSKKSMGCFPNDVGMVEQLKKDRNLGAMNKVVLYEKNDYVMWLVESAYPKRANDLYRRLDFERSPCTGKSRLTHYSIVDEYDWYDNTRKR